jgi:putative FmdB family regulatory protein
MPIYEYACEDCGRVSEVLRQMSEADKPQVCESCGSKRTHRQQSEFAAGASKSSGCPMPPMGGCGGCCREDGMCGMG